jgi:hypothetical protein
MQLEMIPCIVCKNDMPKLRLEKYGYKNCVDCSTTGTYKALVTVSGEGDHTWNDIQILTDEQYSQYSKVENRLNNKSLIEGENESDSLEGFTSLTVEGL